MYKDKKVLIIIPAYNEGESIADTIKLVREKAPDFDMVVINDGSGDDTLEKARSSNVKVLDLPFNLGIGGAMQTGFTYAKYNNYDIAVQLDGDGQHNPEYIEKLLPPIIENKCNMVIGSRYVKTSSFKSSKARRLGMIILTGVISIIIRQKITDTTSGFRAFDKKTIDFFAKHYPQDYPEPEVLVRLYRNKFKICEVPVEMNERLAGKSSITPFNAIYYMLKVILSSFISYIRIFNK